MSLTARQYIALHLYLVEGWTQNRIGGFLSISQPATHYLIQRGRKWFTDTATRDGVISAIHVRDMLHPSPSASITRNVGKAACRQEELLDALEQRMLQRANELAKYRECMSGNSILPVHRARNKHDQWECRYLTEHGVIIDPVADSELPAGWHMEPRRNPRVPDTVYRPKNAAAYCAGTYPQCGITDRCFNCHGVDAR